MKTSRDADNDGLASPLTDICAVYLSEWTTNAAGVGQGGMISTLFDTFLTGLAQAGFTASLSTSYLKPVKPIPGVFKLIGWVDEDGDYPPNRVGCIGELTDSTGTLLSLPPSLFAPY